MSFKRAEFRADTPAVTPHYYAASIPALSVAAPTATGLGASGAALRCTMGPSHFPRTLASDASSVLL